MRRIIYLFYFCSLFLLKNQIVFSKPKNSDVANIIPGIPLAIFFDKNTTVETRNLVEKAISSINNGIKYGRNKWAIQIQTIEIDDSYKLIQSICHQMSRGVLAIFGPTKWSTLNLLTSFTNYYNIPYISWSFLGEKSNEEIEEELSPQLLTTAVMQTVSVNNQAENSNNFKSKESNNDDDYDIDYDGNSNKYLTQVNDYTKFSKKTKVISQLYLRPDIIPTVVELIKFYDWSTVYYIYNYEHAMINLESLFEYQNNNPKFVERILIRKIIDINNFRDMLRAIEASNDKITDLNKESKIVMIIDLDSKESYTKFLNQIKELGMTKTRFCYLLSTLGIYELNINDFRHGGASIFGFSIIDYHNVNSIKLLSDMLQSGEALNKMPIIPQDAALIMDGLAYFSKRINSVIGTNMSKLFGMENVSLRRAEIYVNKSKGINCTYDFKESVEWPLGKQVLNHLKSDREEYEGLTGYISFDSDGRRKNYKINIYKVELNKPLTRIGHYTADKGLVLDEEKVHKTKTQIQNTKQRKLRVVSIRDEPFFMLRDDAANYTGNDRFIGYCVDLTKRLAEIVNFTYEFSLVKDNNFGARDANGVWNGIVGELVRHEADLAVAPLTISSQRERAIEFSMPFMNIGISIMIKKPKKEKPGVFSFMAPLDTKIWLCVVLAYIGVSFVLFLVSRFSPYEWHYDAKKNEKGLTNDFTILNTLWFNLAAVMQQGVDIAPRSVSGRLVASAWWFFTLILISSYTANLAAFLTVERMVSPIESAEQLSRQTEIQYGAVEGGSTKEFFKNSKVDVYMRMWNFMQSWGPSVFVKNNQEGVKKVRDPSMKYAFLLESSLNEYLNERHPCNTMKVGTDLDSKGYGVATPIGSDLKEPINLAILQLREEGFLDELKTRWWYDRSECGGNSGAGKDSSQNALDLINVAGIFYILIIGLVLSVLVVTLELLYKARILSQKNKILFSEAVKSKMRFSITGYDDSLNEFRNKMGLDDNKHAPYAN